MRYWFLADTHLVSGDARDQSAVLLRSVVQAANLSLEGDDPVRALFDLGDRGWKTCKTEEQIVSNTAAYGEIVSALDPDIEFQKLDGNHETFPDLRHAWLESSSGRQLHKESFVYNAGPLKLAFFHADTLQVNAKSKKGRHACLELSQENLSDYRSLMEAVGDTPCMNFSHAPIGDVYREVSEVITGKQEGKEDFEHFMENVFNPYSGFYKNFSEITAIRKGTATPFLSLSGHNHAAFLKKGYLGLPSATGGKTSFSTQALVTELRVQDDGEVSLQFLKVAAYPPGASVKVAENVLPKEQQDALRSFNINRIEEMPYALVA